MRYVCVSPAIENGNKIVIFYPWILRVRKQKCNPAPIDVNYKIAMEPNSS